MLKGLSPYGISIILVFHFACFDFLKYLIGLRTVKLFKGATVVHMLEIDMNEDCHELVCGLSKER